MTTAPTVLALALLLSMLAGSTWVAAAPVSFSATGQDPAAIQTTVDAFRAALGDPNNGNAPGPLPTGRREINWDGTGALVAAPAGNPFNGFVNNRGAQFQTPGTGFLQAPPTGAPGSFDAINATYATTFAPFSLPRLFSAIGSPITDVFFFIPGTGGTVPATVGGFGAIFSDVDLPDSSSLQFFDPLGASLGQFFVPPASGDADFSFLGVIFNAGEQIFRVRMTAGNTALGPTDNPLANVDVAVLDDLFYREPQAVPEPATALLLTIGVIALAGRLTRGR